ncbi:MAG TPA: serine O-acetyltransferase [Cyclobacteriaceae bacterium]|nr:serine O-acetyltransferase [Cyclobacteriaceae bacterium]
MEKAFITRLYQAHRDCPPCPSPAKVITFLDGLLATLFPDFGALRFASEREFELHIEGLKLELDHLLFNVGESLDAERIASEFFDALPEIHRMLINDAISMLEGDPASTTQHEVIRTYPGFYAIAAYRVANVLLKLEVPDIPRIITEHAHSKTGIDIHPGATIGEFFCIDHGTGVVIGETTHIGSHVKIYQGVTLGALSVSKEDAKRKRHPTIEDHVVLYAGASILGGDTVIGHHSVIGGNVWLTRSVPPHSRVYYQARMNNGDSNESDLMVIRSGGHD